MENRDAQLNTLDAGWAEHLSMVEEQLSALLWSTDTALRVTSSRGAGFANLGFVSDQLVGNHLTDFLGTDDFRCEFIAAHRRALDGEVVTYDTAWQARHFHVRIQPTCEGAGIITGTNGVAIDTTEHHHAEASLRRIESRYRSLVQHALEMTIIMNADGQITYESPSNERILGYEVGDLTTTNGFSMVYPDDLTIAWEQFAESLAQPGATIRAELRVRHKNGSWRWVEALLVNLLHDPAIEGLLINSRDITERKTLEQQLTHLAYHDALTGLANRRQFEERLAESLRSPQQQVVVLLIDLDGFKAVNDSLGHGAGDELLAEVASKLKAVIRGENLVARFGGDEFAVLFPSDGDVEGATRTAQRLIDLLRMPFKTTAFEVTINASVGIAASTAELATPMGLLRAADVALYRAKASAAKGIAIFDPHLDEAALDRLERERELHHALERGELRLDYQPIVDLASGMIVGVETLLRWRHPTRGMLHPRDFIVLAEESGLIAPIGRWVLEHACRQTATWQRLRERPLPLRLHVNVSGRELRQSRLIADLTDVVRKSQLDPTSLTLEITERTAIADLEGVDAMLSSLRRQGVQIALDDFGTGYAALSSLKNLSIDELKVDTSFVAGLGTIPLDTAIIQALTGVAKALSLKVTAEGIENPEQANILRDMDCTQGQGRYFAPPLSSEDMTALLTRANRLPEATQARERAAR